MKMPVDKNTSLNKTPSKSPRSPQQRKLILRNVLTRAQVLQEKIDKNTIRTLDEVFEESDTIAKETTLHEKIDNQDEIVLDSEVMKVTSKVIRQCSKQISKQDTSYESVEFAEKLMNFTQNILPGTMMEEIDWSILENQVTKYFKSSPLYTTFAGIMEPLPKKEIIRKKNQSIKDTQTSIVRPNKVTVMNKEETSVEQTIERIRKLITQNYRKDKKPIDFFKFILHPSDFGKTVENILHTSFLIRDGIIKLKEDDSGILVIEPCSKEMIAKGEKAGKGSNVQYLLDITLTQWKTLKDTYRLQKPMIGFD